MNQIQPRCQVDNDTLHLVALLNPHLRYVRRHVCGVDWDTALIGGDLDYEETLLRTSLQRSIWAIFDYVEGILPGCDQACLPKELVLQPFRGMLMACLLSRHPCSGVVAHSFSQRIGEKDQLRSEVMEL